MPNFFSKVRKFKGVGEGADDYRINLVKYQI